MSNVSTIDLCKDTRFAAFVDGLAELRKAGQGLSLNENRKLKSNFFAGSGPKEQVKKVEDVEVLGKDNNPIKIRIFTPESSAKELPIFLYFHPGAWIFNSVEDLDSVCRMYANHLGCIIVSAGYRLAPENPFPKPLEDCRVALDWVAQNCERLGSNKDLIIVGGESAGGNLAAALSMMVRDQGGPAIAAQVLIYPPISSTLNEAAYRDSPDQFFLTKMGMEFAWAAYAPRPEDKRNPYASLDYAKDLSGLPPALVVTGEYDPLREEGESHAKRLVEAGVKTYYKNFPGVIHGFFGIPAYDELQQASWIDQIKELFDKLLEK